MSAARAGIPNHLVLSQGADTVVAVQHHSRGNSLPAIVDIDKKHAKAGAEALFAADESLKEALFGADVLFAATTGQVCVSVTKFKAVFSDIAYVTDADHPLRPHGNAYMCTCNVYGLAQQCMHTLFVEGLDVTPQSRRRNFDDVPGVRLTGRPKGKAKAAPRRTFTPKEAPPAIAPQA